MQTDQRGNEETKRVRTSGVHQKVPQIPGIAWYQRYKKEEIAHSEL